MVIVTLHRPVPIRLLEARCEPPNVVIRLVNGYLVARTRQIVCGCQATRSCSDNRYSLHKEIGAVRAKSFTEQRPLLARFSS